MRLLASAARTDVGGTISEIVMPTDVRAALAKNLNFYLSHYNPEPLGGVQREFH